MKNQSLLVVLVFLFLSTLSGCAVVGGIFKAGMGVGVFIVVLIILAIIFLVRMMRKNK